MADALINRMEEAELVMAADWGDLQAVQELLARGVDPNADDGDWNALSVAAMRGHLPVVQELLARGADPNADDGDWNALHSAAMMGHLPVVRALLARGADPNTIFRDSTSLHIAARRGHLPVVQELLAWDADPTLEDDQGRTPIDYPIVQRAWQEFNVPRLAARHGIDEYSRIQNLPPGFSDRVYRNLYRR